LESVCERDHVRPEIPALGKDGANNLVGNNLKAHLDYLEKEMRNAAADLDFERAARLRDEIKRLPETELAISDDPLAREVELESPDSGRRKGQHNKGRARHRAVDDAKGRPGLFRKPDLDEMGTTGDHAVPTGARFRKNTLDEMTVGRTERPVEGTAPEKPGPVRRERVGLGSYEESA